MSTRIAIFWPGDYRIRPNELALPNVTEATQPLERALTKLGRAYLGGFNRQRTRRKELGFLHPTKSR
jgi:hypothetical protein